jgi:ADP-heptose:LPS heptosyltransferase
MIINVGVGVFGGPIRNGDMIGVINVIQSLRKQTPGLKFHMKPGSINSEDYCVKFFNFLMESTDFFSQEPGQEDISWRSVNLWDFRDIIGDNVSIGNNVPMKKKICVFPVIDAPYNTYRNWPSEVFQNILNEYSSQEYDDYERIVCIKNLPQNIELNKFVCSTDFMENIHNILDCEIFVGGDTGTSHFAWSLDRGPKELIYYNSSRGLIHTMPFYLISGKGKTKTYWLNFDGTKF